MLKFHLDENVDHGIAVGLGGRGLSCTTTAGAGLMSADDAGQLAHCLREGRVIVSHDGDMLRLARAGTQHAGVAWSAMHSRTIGQIVTALVYLSRNRSAEQMRNWVEYL